MLAENKRIAQRYLEDVFNRGNLAAVDEIAAINFVSHDPAAGGEVTGIEGFKQWILAAHAILPDLKFTIEDSVAEGDRVAVRWTLTSAYEGEALGLPAKDRPITVSGVDIFRIVDGKIEEVWVTLDTLRLVTQLGLLPA